jgi:DNA polymerase I
MLAYGMSKYKLSDTLQIGIDEADKIINKFFSKVPKVQEFLITIGNLAKKRGYIKTAPPYSRVRIFPKWQAIKLNPTIEEKSKWLGSIERAGKNTPEQGTNGDIIKSAIIKVQNYIDVNNLDVNLLLTVYDEIQTEANINIAEFWRDKLQELMIEAATEVIKEIPVVVDVKITNYWSK